MAPVVPGLVSVGLGLAPVFPGLALVVPGQDPFGTRTAPVRPPYRNVTALQDSSSVTQFLTGNTASATHLLRSTIERQPSQVRGGNLKTSHR